MVERLAKREGVVFSKKKSLKASTASFDCEGEAVVLAYPETFMNRSGDALRPLISHYSIHPQKNLLVVIDDAAIPFGRLRLRARGTDGGHNGLKSVEQALASKDYARLRVGIAPASDPSDTLEEFVLSEFTADEKRKWPMVLEDACEACRLWITQPVSAAMNAVNARVTKS